MKLYSVSVMENCEMEHIIILAENEEQAKEKALQQDWSCPMGVFAYEIDEVDGYKVILQKIE